MNDKKFWKIIYLYITKYNYNIIYYRPEKKDVWLIDENNELIRFIYSDSFKNTEIDSIVSNVIRNEARLKKMFRLNSLKLKICYIAPEFDDIAVEYKKYRISNGLMIERILYNEKNNKLFIKDRDTKFIEDTPDTLRYKKRVIELYKKQSLNRSFLDLKFNILSLVYFSLFVLNMLVMYLSNTNYSLYRYLNYNYQEIISGQFYRMFTSAFITSSVKSLLVILATLIISSILFNKTLNTWKNLVVLMGTSFVLNLFLIFGYSGNIDIALTSNFAVVGAIFANQLSKRNDNLMFMYSSAISVIYLLCGVVFFDISITLYIFAFILGIFSQIAVIKRRNFVIYSTVLAVIVFLGVLVKGIGIDTKGVVNNYRVNKVDARLENPHTDEDIFNLERELLSENKSVLTYYELGMIKLSNSSRQDAKKIFLEGVEFDNTFAPIYYNLGLLERQEGNYSKSKEYAQKAYDFDKKDKYKNLLDEMNKY